MLLLLVPYVHLTASTGGGSGAVRLTFALYLVLRQPRRDSYRGAFISWTVRADNHNSRN